MKKAIGTALLFLLAVLGFAAPAQAEGTDPQCQSVEFDLTNRDDTATDGSVWAKDTMTRVLEVCAVEMPTDSGTWIYRATVTDSGTFRTTRTNKSPHELKPMMSGIEGTITGGFIVPLFTAAADYQGLARDGLTNKTPSSGWVKAAFPSAESPTIGSYQWQYKTPCQTYTDNNGVYSGDITSRCATPAAPTVNPATCQAKGELVIHETTGVRYVVTPPNRQGEVVVTAKARTGYILTGTTRWELTIPNQLTGEACDPTEEPGDNPPSPPQSPVPTPTHTGGANPVPSASTALVGASETLPVTGPRVPMAAIIGLGVIILGAGVGLVAGVRMRRTE